MQDLFFGLVQVSLGNIEHLERKPTEKEWAMLFDMACRHSMAGITLGGVNRLSEVTPSMKPPMNILYEWIGLQQQTIAQNELQNKRAKELCKLFKNAGFRSCVLKGQGTALYYSNPEYRECGDIDVWISGYTESADTTRDKVLKFAKQEGYNIGHIDIKHSDIEFFKDVSVEVHFLPSWMYCPFTNKKLQQFFEKKMEQQFVNVDAKMGFAHTTIDFDLVYSMVHIYRHIFSEGIGLRQLVDYYYILQNSSEPQRNSAFDTLCHLNMNSFVGGIMWIMMECFGMNIKYSLCQTNEKHGKFLLSEIMAAGNFGHFDDRIKKINKNEKFKRGFVQLGRNLRFLSYYPSEVLWSPFWKLWHWCWRKQKGYL